MVYNKKRRRRTKKKRGGLTVTEKLVSGVGSISRGAETAKVKGENLAEWSKETARQAGEEYDKEKERTLGEQIQSAAIQPAPVGGKRRRRRKTKRKRKTKRRKSRKKGRKKKKTFLCPYKKHYCKH